MPLLLSEAYDSVDRNLLFAKLEGLGMDAHSISTLRSLYEVHCEGSPGHLSPLTAACAKAGP